MAWTQLGSEKSGFRLVPFASSASTTWLAFSTLAGSSVVMATERLAMSPAIFQATMVLPSEILDRAPSW
ncbi:hypothetical protein D3C87_1665030 [compost metagenome]